MTVIRHDLLGVAEALHRRCMDSDVTGYASDPFTLEIYAALVAAYDQGRDDQRMDDAESVDRL
jgi:hypothetical protein